MSFIRFLSEIARRRANTPYISRVVDECRMVLLEKGSYTPYPSTQSLQGCIHSDSETKIQLQMPSSILNHV